MNTLPPNTAKQIVSLIYWQSGDDVVNGAWYWRDEFCDEPMGPFLTRSEAAADYRLMRHTTNQGGVAK